MVGMTDDGYHGTTEVSSSLGLSYLNLSGLLSFFFGILKSGFP